MTKGAKTTTGEPQANADKGYFTPEERAAARQKVEAHYGQQISDPNVLKTMVEAVLKNPNALVGKELKDWFRR
jgi:hypothetical protein